MEKQKCIEYFSQHLCYEYEMLFFCADRVPKLDNDINNTMDQSDKKKSQNEFNAILEAFAVHARVMLEFLFEDGFASYRGTVRASNYRHDGSCWFSYRQHKLEGYPALTNAKNICNYHIMHPKKNRLEEVKQKIDVKSVVRDINSVMEMFGKWADKDYLGESSQFDSIQDRVSVGQPALIGQTSTASSTPFIAGAADKQ